jgi:glycosyltransferase involved in cell wall biosynthesis
MSALRYSEPATRMKICLVTAFPPSCRQLNEYAFHIARELQGNPGIELTILGDELSSYDFATDADGNGLAQHPELPNFRVIRCWKFNSLTTPSRLAQTVRRIRPDVVWFNLVFSTFATQENPIVAFAGLCTPALTRALGFYTHVTLHHILEHVDLAGAGVQREGIFRLGSELATRVLLAANSVSVLLSGYRQTLIEKYAARNVLLGTHGVFKHFPTPPVFSKRGNPDHRILAIGHWGTYKRLETLVEAFPIVAKYVPNLRLIIAGANHHTKPGYWESIRESQRGNPNIEFRGYVPEAELPELFSTASIVAMPYNSATGSSGPAHQACEYGVPIVCADIPDLRIMAADEDMAIDFHEPGNASDLAEKLIGILRSPERQRRMAEQNFLAALRMTMPNVVRNYLRWFELVQKRKALEAMIYPHPRQPRPAARIIASLLRRTRNGREPATFKHGLSEKDAEDSTPSIEDPSSCEY